MGVKVRRGGETAERGKRQKEETAENRNLK
jgi:hypothetical protein